MKLQDVRLTDVAKQENLLLARERVQSYYGDFTLRACPIGDRAWFLADDATLRGLGARLRDGRYAPERADFDFVSKNTYTRRPISIPLVEDLVVAQAILNLIGPELDATISNRSFAYRVDSGRPQFIIKRYAEWVTFRAVIEKGVTPDRPSLLISDITSFYENIVLSTLERTLLELGVPREIADVVDLQFRAWQWRPRYVAHRETGLPQGGNPITSFYANLYLRRVDAFIESRDDVQFERWVDDLVVHVPDELTARQVTRDLDNTLRNIGLSMNPAKTMIVPPGDIEHRFAFDLMQRVNQHIKSAWNRWDEPEVAAERADLFEEAKMSANSSVFNRSLKMLHLAQQGDHLNELYKTLVKKPALSTQILEVFESSADVAAAARHLLSLLRAPENIWPDQERLVWRSLRRMEVPPSLTERVRRLAKQRVSRGTLCELARSEAALSTIWFGSEGNDREGIVKFATSDRANTPRFAKACVLAAGLTRGHTARAAVDWAIRQPDRAVVDFGLFLSRYVDESEFADRVLSTIKTRSGPYRTDRQRGMDVEDILLLAHGSRSQDNDVLNRVAERARSLLDDVTDARTRDLLDEIVAATKA